MNVFVVGIGLIGGSMARDIKRLNPNSEIYGIDTHASHLEEALALNLIDFKSSYDDLNLANLVIVSIPVDAMLSELPKILEEVNDDCVVIDVGSTKAA
ncbi:MAG: prephenate dehydrogenase/arogenate dehydrogenase family protein, partial [Maribacter sp.]|nr:prephenate dehydrogenase/arogenate dehydrogenase family protein [Maribacter sp.]